MKEVKEDSTRGRSYIRPKRYKRDALMQAWVDRRKVATLSVWLDRCGYQTRFMSDVLKWTIDIVVDELVRKGVVEEVQTTGDAEMVLGKYKVELNPGGRGNKNVMHNLVLDSMRHERENRFEVEDVSRPIEKGSFYSQVRRDTEIAMAKYREMEASGEFERREDEKRGGEIEEQKRRAIENARRAGKLAEEPRDTRPAKDHVIDVEESERRALERDKEIAEAEMMPPEGSGVD